MCQSTCCNNTASEHAMMGRLMRDDAAHWVQDYGVGGWGGGWGPGVGCPQAWTRGAWAAGWLGGWPGGWLGPPRAGGSDCSADAALLAGGAGRCRVDPSFGFIPRPSGVAERQG